MIETSRKLLRVLLEHMFIPAMVGTEDLDETLRALKEGAVHYVRRRFGADIDLAAMHFGKSTRWIYRVLAGKSDEPVRRSGRREEGGDDSKGHGHHYGYALMVAAVEFYHSRYPQRLPASVCARALRREGFEINALELAPLLDMYCGMGYLTKTIEQTGGEQEVRYQGQRGSHKAPSADSENARLERVGARSRLIFPIARAYVEEVPHTYFSEMGGQLLPEVYEQLAADIHDFIIKALEAADERSNAIDPEGTRPVVHFRGLYLMGRGPWTDPIERAQGVDRATVQSRKPHD